MCEAECKVWWNTRFADSPPVGFMLRQTYPERWLRIHSLPGSKRYAETEAEYAEMSRRHNTVAGDVLSEGASCYLIHSSWVEPGDSLTGWAFNLEGEEQALRCDVRETTWRRNYHDKLLREVADFRNANVIFASRDTERVYAPYDGGADLIFRNDQERNERKQVYEAWLSAHPDGL